VSYLEIYNETIYDLLSKSKKGLKQYEDNTGNVYIKDLTEKEIITFKDGDLLLKYGNLNRSTGKTDLNNNSSRSHCVITIKLLKKYSDEEILNKKIPCVK
jgi:hypothetical protein